MVNSSLTYEILLYLNSFYFGMFGACEFGMGLLKAVNLKYVGNQLYHDSIVLIMLLTLESVRIYFGRHGSLSEHGNSRRREGQNQLDLYFKFEYKL